MAIIPAIHLSEKKQTCSIQVITEKGTWNQEYPAREFHIDRKRLYMRIGENLFSKKGIRLKMRTGEVTIEGILRFGAFTRPTYDIMGPFRFVPRMECRHAVYSMIHSVDGRLNMGDASISFHKDLGYMEGDSGTSFPVQYVWTQHFLPKEKGAFMLAAAKIPLGPLQFTGTIGILRSGKKEYRFATYLGATVEKMGRKLVIRQGKYRLVVQCLEDERKHLYAPCRGQMNRTIGENVSGSGKIILMDQERILLRCKTRKAAFEWEL